MASRRPAEIIAELAAGYAKLGDADLLAALDALPELPDESDAAWDDDAFWLKAAYPYVALGDVAASRKMLAAIEPLLAKACFGDPGEIMRGLRHNLEAIVEPEWTVLADLCLRASASPRLGTKLWALDQLAILDDERARPLFEEALRSEETLIRDAADIGLARLSESK